MPQIVLDNIFKTFKVVERSEGKFGLIKSAIIRKRNHSHPMKAAQLDKRK
jgi:hypothetical protein